MTLVMDNNDLLSTANSTNLSPRKQIIAKHFSRASHYNQHARIQQKICQQLCDKIVADNQDSVLEVGAGRGQLTRLLAENITSKHWLINELCESQAEVLMSILPNANLAIGDAETIPLSVNNNTKHSLIISANAIQWFDNPLRFVEQSYKRLAPAGQLLFNTFTPDNFLQIKTLTGQGLTYPSNSDWQHALENLAYKGISLETYQYDLQFPSPYDVLKHMKLTGVSTNQAQMSSLLTSTNEPQPFMWTKSKLKAFETSYWQNFSTVNIAGKRCVTLTYSVLIINAFKA